MPLPHNAGAAEPFYEVNGLEDHAGESVTFDGDNTFADMSYVLHEFVQAVVISNTTTATLYYDPNDATADATKFPITAGQVVKIKGNRRKLLRAHFFLAVSGTIGLIQEVALQDTAL